jgi:hypothetical protein
VTQSSQGLERGTILEDHVADPICRSRFRRPAGQTLVAAALRSPSPRCWCDNADVSVGSPVALPPSTTKSNAAASPKTGLEGMPQHVRGFPFTEQKRRTVLDFFGVPLQHQHFIVVVVRTRQRQRRQTNPIEYASSTGPGSSGWVGPDAGP